MSEAKEGKLFGRKKLLDPLLGTTEGTKITSTIIFYTSHALTVYSIAHLGACKLVFNSSNRAHHLSPFALTKRFGLIWGHVDGWMFTLVHGRSPSLKIIHWLDLGSCGWCLNPDPNNINKH